MNSMDNMFEIPKDRPKRRPLKLVVLIALVVLTFVMVALR